MSAHSLNLTQLAVETTQALDTLWNTIGVSNEERQAFLDELSERVAALYTSAVTEQNARKDDLEAEIQTLRVTIENMECAMEQNGGVPSQGKQTLLQYRDSLEAIRAQLQNLWDEREKQLKELEGELFQLYDDVDDDIEPNFTSVGDRMTLARIEEYRGEIVRLQAVKVERTAQINTICDEIVDMWNEMELEAANDEVEPNIVETRAAMGWGLAMIETLNSKLQVLQEEKRVREEKITEMGKQITALWKRLLTPEEEQTAFLEDHAGLSEATIAAVEAYLGQKAAEFQDRLVELIADARKQIDGMWSVMRAGTTQREAMFPPYYADGPFTDELYQVHETYISQLTAALEDLKPILKGIEKREELKGDRAEYETIISDPSRLLGRGNSVARLKEEKLERRVKKELPAVTKRLREQIKEWETRSGREFTVDDVRYLDSLDAEEAAEQKAKDDAKAARDAAKGTSTTATAVEPVKSTSRSTSVGRMSVYRGAPPAPIAAAAKKLGATLPRKTSSAGIDASEGGEDIGSAVINAKRAAGATVTAPAIPAKENAKPTAAAVKESTVVISDASKASAAKILAQL